MNCENLSNYSVDLKLYLSPQNITRVQTGISRIDTKSQIKRIIMRLKYVKLKKANIQLS